MKKRIIKNSPMVVLFLSVVLVGLEYIFTHAKGDFTLWMISHRTSSLDTVFSVLTELGSGWIFIGACVLGLFYNVRFSIHIFILAVLAGIVIFSLKSAFAFPRPVVFFEWLSVGEYTPFRADELEIEFNSFPSGHMTAACSLYFFLLFASNNILVKFSMVFLAIGVGLSRIYLGFHFLQDVLLGGILGLALGYLVYGFWRSPKIIGRELNVPILPALVLLRDRVSDYMGSRTTDKGNKTEEKV